MTTYDDVKLVKPNRIPQPVQVRLGVNVLTSALCASFVVESKLYGILLFHFRRAFILNNLLSNAKS